MNPSIVMFYFLKYKLYNELVHNAVTRFIKTKIQINQDFNPYTIRYVTIN